MKDVACITAFWCGFGVGIADRRHMWQNVAAAAKMDEGEVQTATMISACFDSLKPREETMSGIDRRTAIALSLGVAAFIGNHSAPTLAAVGDETKIAEGVTAKILGEGPSIIPGFAKVRLRDITMQPGSNFAPRQMMNSMICHTLEGEMEIDQGERKFTAKKGDVWTCTTGMSEGAANKGSTVAVMRVADLLPS